MADVQRLQDRALPRDADVHDRVEAAARLGVALFQVTQQREGLLFESWLTLQARIGLHVEVQHLRERHLPVAGGQHQQGDLLADVVDEVANLQVVALEAQEPGQHVADQGVARPPHVRGRVGVDRGVLQQRGAAGAGAVRSVGRAGGAHGADHSGNQVAGIDEEVEVRPVGGHLPEGRRQLDGRRQVGGDLRRGAPQRTGQGKARHRQVAQ